MLTGVVFYLIGVAVTLLIDFVMTDSGISPPASFMAFLFFTLVGLYRLVKTVILVYRDKDRETNKGEMLVHLCFFSIGFVLFFYMILNN